MCIFSFDSYCQFSKVCTNSCFYQKTQFPLLFSFTYAWYNQLDITFFFFLTILWLWWRSQCGLIDIFLLTGDLSTFSFAISLLNILFYKVSIQVSFAHFKQIVLSFFFFLIEMLGFLCILDMKSLLKIWTVKISFHPVACHFTLVSVDELKF